MTESFRQWYASLLPTEEVTAQKLREQLWSLKSSDLAGVIVALGITIILMIVAAVVAIEYEEQNRYIFMMPFAMLLLFGSFTTISRRTWVARLIAADIRKIDETLDSTPGAQALLDTLLEYEVPGTLFYREIRKDRVIT